MIVLALLHPASCPCWYYTATMSEVQLALHSTPHNSKCVPRQMRAKHLWMWSGSARILLLYDAVCLSLLQGKYLAPGGGPPSARLNKYRGRYAEAESRYGPRPNVQQAVKQYAELAEALGMTPTALALR